MQRRTFLLLIALPSVIILGMNIGCSNIFGVFGAPAPTGTYDELTLLGENEAQAKRYDNALVYFDAAIAKKPSGARARVHAADTVLMRDLLGISMVFQAFTSASSGSIYSNLLYLMNNPATGTDLFSSSGSFATIANYLNDRSGYSYAYRQCDSAISNTDVIANFELMIASLFLTGGELFDSNGDKHYAQADDLFSLDGSGNLQVNPASFNIDAMTNTTLLAEGALTDMSYSDLTNLIAMMRTTHNTLESLIDIFQTIYSSIKRVDDINAAAIRIGSAASGPVFGFDLNSSVSEVTNAIYTVGTNIRGPFNAMSATLNNLHFVMAGSYAYPSNDTVYFSPTAWESHSGGMKGAADGALTVLNSIASFGIPLSDLTNWTAITNSLATNDITAFSNFINDFAAMSNQMTNIMGMLTNFSTNWTGF